MASKKKLLQAAAGSAGGAGLDVDDVFSTYVYDGTGSIKVIDNGIALGNAGDGGSGEFVLNGGSSNEAGYLSIPSSTDFGFGTGDFTIEMFVYPRATQGYSGFFSTINTGTPVGVMVGTFSDGTLTFDFNSTSGGSSEASALTNGAWSHVALTRNGTSVNLWVNGTSVATATNSDNLGSSESAVIGRFYTTMNGFGFNGHLSNVRVIKGTALYTSSFTAPTSALTAVSGTVLLTLQGDEPFTDNSSSSHTLTANSTVYTSAFGPFTGTSGEGGLVWTKRRDHAGNGHMLVDTARGGSSFLKSHTTDAANTSYTLINSFNSNGYTLSTNGWVNGSGDEVCSWTWRKAPKFFDVVTYTGTGVNGRTVSHNLGAAPGMIIVKQYSAAGEPWYVYHRSLGGTKRIYLNTTGTAGTTDDGWFNTEPTSTEFTVAYNGTNKVGASYVAYLFAHNDSDGEFGPDADQDIIKCGSFTASSSKTASINLGFEPQWLMIKSSSVSEEWIILDNMRGLVLNASDHALFSNSNIAEETGKNYVNLTPTGFDIEDNVTGSADYIYMAIRRGSLAEPENATDVFDVNKATNPRGFVTTGFPVDLHMQRKLESGDGFNLADRLRGERKFLYTTETSAEYTFSSTFPAEFDHMNGIDNYSYSSQTKDTIFYNWKRAPSFFDVVCYNGTGSAQNITHNLGVTPEFYIVKRRDSTGGWYAYHKSIDKDGDGLPETDAIQINGNNAAFDSANYWNDTAPTATTFTVGTTSAVNASGGKYVAYLFASLDGIAKVGGYTGNGSSSGPTVNLGFAPRFVFITKWGGTAGGGNKYAFDTERGIVAGNDPFLDFRNTNAEDSSSDLIDPDSNGFTISSSNGNINANGGEYMFYAVA